MRVVIKKVKLKIIALIKHNIEKGMQSLVDKQISKVKDDNLKY